MNTLRTLKELAEWSGINYYTLVSAALPGRLVAHKSGSTWLSTRHAVEEYRRVAVFKPRRDKEIPKKISIKIKNNISGGLWAENDQGVIASAFDDRTGFGCSGMFYLGYHSGEMPAHASEKFTTLEELEVAMRKFAPDMRKWKTTFSSQNANLKDSQF